MMKLFTAEEVRTKLERLKCIEEYTKPLLLIEANLDNPPQGHKIYQDSQVYSGTPQEKAPEEHDSMAGVNIPSPLPYLDGDKVCKLYQYLQQNGGYQLIPTKEDGDCLFGAWRRGTALPIEVADAHVRRLIVKTMINYHEFSYEQFKHQIALLYGHDRDSPEELQQHIDAGDYTTDQIREQRLPGPFSFYSYLKFMLQNSSYGDDMIILTMSQIWQQRITILDAGALFERRFRHNNIITKTDILIVHHSSTQHFVGTGKCSEAPLTGRKPLLVSAGNFGFTYY